MRNSNQSQSTNIMKPNEAIFFYRGQSQDIDDLYEHVIQLLALSQQTLPAYLVRGIDIGSYYSQPVIGVYVCLCVWTQEYNFCTRRIPLLHCF